MSKQYTAMDIANYFIHYNNYRRMETGDDLISNNKMQRLLYYAQGTMLALKNKKLFDDDICAFHYGPAVESVYNEFSKYDAGINKRVNNDELVIDDKTVSLLEKCMKHSVNFQQVNLRK